MRGIIVMTMFVVSLADGAWQDYEEVRDLATDADGLTEFVIDAGAGSLSIVGIDGAADIAVTATIRVEGRDEEAARELIQKRLRLTLDREGEQARLVADTDGGWGWGGNAVIDLDVQMPAGVALVVDDGSGQTIISGVLGDIAIDDGSGSIELSNVGSVRIDDGSGSIKVTDSAGDVYVEDGSGTIDIRNVVGSVTINDGSGSITVDNVERNLVIEDDGSGSVNFTNVRGEVERFD